MHGRPQGGSGSRRPSGLGLLLPALLLGCLLLAGCPDDTGKTFAYYSLELDTATGALQQGPFFPNAGEKLKDRRIDSLGSHDGRIYMVLNTCETYAYDPAAGVWTEKTGPPRATGGYRALPALSTGGRLYCFGTDDTSAPSPVSHLYEYDPASDTWSAKTAAPVTAVTDMTLCAGEIYLFSGPDLHAYDPVADA